MVSLPSGKENVLMICEYEAFSSKNSIVVLYRLMDHDFYHTEQQVRDILKSISTNRLFETRDFYDNFKDIRVLQHINEVWQSQSGNEVNEGLYTCKKWKLCMLPLSDGEYSCLRRSKSLKWAIIMHVYPSSWKAPVVYSIKPSDWFFFRMYMANSRQTHILLIYYTLTCETWYV